jgi:hypothetical protein
MIALQFSVDATEYQGDIGITPIQMDRQISIRLTRTLMHVIALEYGELMVSA